MKRSLRIFSWGLASILALGAAAVNAEPPKTATDELTYAPGKTVKWEMVQLPAGKTKIKDKDGKEKEVEVKPVWIAKLEVRWDEYVPFYQSLDLTEEQRAKKVDAENRPSPPYLDPRRGFGDTGWPAGSVAAQSAHRFCEWLSKKTGKKYRLPTEAEWNYAATAGGTAVAPKNDDELKKAAWFADNSDEKTQACGKLAPNPWGLHDMLGNVGEWVTREGQKEVVAGGSYVDTPDAVKTDSRAEHNQDWQRDDPQFPKSKWWLSNGGHVGLRLVREE